MVLEQVETLFQCIRIVFGKWILTRLPKPTGLGMVSLSSFCFSLPLILLRLRSGHIPFAAYWARAAIRSVLKHSEATEGRGLCVAGL